MQENVHVGMTTRSMSKGLEGNIMIEPEDSMSNIGSRVSGTSNLSEAQIEIQRQLETNQALANLILPRLAREEKAAELQAELAIKQAALKAEFLKKGLEGQRSNSGSQVSSRRSACPRTDLIFDTHDGFLDTNRQQIKAVNSVGCKAVTNTLLLKTAVRED